MTIVSKQKAVTHHTCPECGKEYKCYYEENYLEPCPSKEVKYLCSKCQNKAESTPEFGEEN